MKQINTAIPDEIYERIEEIAKKEGYTSVPELVRDLLRDWLKERENGGGQKPEVEVTA